MYCNNCGKQIKDNSAFCDNCGARQSISQSQFVQNPSVQPSLTQQSFQPSKKVSKGLKVAFFCTLTAAVVALAVFSYSQWFAPKPAGQTFVWDDEIFISKDTVLNENYTLLANSVEFVAEPIQQTAPVPQLIIGIWEVDTEGVYIAFEFFADGSLYYYEDGDAYIYSYSIANGEITLIEDGEAIAKMPYSFDGDDTLILTMEGETYLFVRISAATDPDQQIMPEPQLIIDIWEAEIEGAYVVFEFLADGSFYYYEDGNAYIYSYTMANGVITLFEDDEAIAEMSYSFKDPDTLSLTIDGNAQIFTRLTDTQNIG